MKIDSFKFSSPGGRELNEDYVGMSNTNTGGIFVLADGLGGHRFGELASECAVNTILSELSDVSETDTEIQARIQKSIENANTKIIELQQEKAASMKSTVVVLNIDSDSAFWANVGDSRLYYLSNSEIKAITEDHSVAYKKYKCGEITRAQIGSDEDQSSLLRVLGKSDSCAPDFASAKLNLGDGFMLCSDGIWEYLYDNEVLFDFLKADTAREWAELMLLRVIERIPGDNDNLSLITIILK
ncbi:MULTISPECIES: PP2C family serine/threonine-protein phosphatase [unclassified Ruminococcus]|uniref:PP2C family protein-serine/threonine phosphatase n=1 Tax=unclassified Ruminococcus TaxID=2608920 RepID=UPI00210BEB93|nr:MULTISPECIES: protein phosphatase 2C domain-containing protein [unclassified Ruminococcus]MCQ4022113.1 SpoIIE family protein phosphatase [Ruminococcus sp. zg-924]MCQ4114433.1 SpoIIE family protein phosphatase [Ruminococcus sp. zg-921]